MKKWILAAVFSFSAPAFPRGGDSAVLNGNPLPAQALEVFSILVDYRAQIAQLYADTTGAELKVQNGVIRQQIQDSTATTTYMLQIMKCASQICLTLDNLFIQKTVTQTPKGLVTAYAPLERRSDSLAGDEMQYETAELATLFFKLRTEISRHYDGPEYAPGTHFAHLRGVDNLKRADPVTTTSYSLEALVCGDVAWQYCYWTHTLTITEEAVKDQTGAVTKTYTVKVKGSGLG